VDRTVEQLATENVPAAFAAEPALSEAEAFRRAGDEAHALPIYIDLARTYEVPPAKLSASIARCYEHLGSYQDAISWLIRVVDATDSFLAWSSAGATLARLTKHAPARARAHCRVAVTGSYNVSQFAKMLPLATLRLGVGVTSFESLYGQYQQDLLDRRSSLYRSKPHQIVLAVHEGAVKLPENSDSPAVDVEAESARWKRLWDAVGDYSAATIIQHNFAPRPESVFGNLASGLPGSRYAMLHALNHILAQSAPGHVSIVDCERLSANFGRARWFDDRYWLRSKQAVALDALPLLARQSAAVIASRTGLSRKCLVLDLDNTLWGGIIGEDGINGIHLGGDGSGEAFVAFQDYLLALKDRGVLLAIASKNNEADAREVFERHPEMHIRLNDISAFVVNWDDKPANLRRIAARLGIALDALVLVDDNPAERQMVRRLAPDVDIVSLPPDPSGYRRALADYLGFEPVAVTLEDRMRTTQYRARAAAHQLASSAADIESFLSELRMEATVAPFDDLRFSRIAQLCGKTNQFNLTTRRHSPAALRDFMANPSYVTRYLELRDRLTDHGLVALAIAEIQPDALDIDTFLMSCRVIGRTVEEHLLAELSRSAARLGLSTLRGTYVPTAKNGIVRDLYRRFGFQRLSGGDDGATCWEYDLRALGPITSKFIAESQA